jgi:hypothetical protein
MLNIKWGRPKWLCHGVRENEIPSPCIVHVTRLDGDGFLYFFRLICRANLNGIDMMIFVGRFIYLFYFNLIIYNKL